MSELRALRTFLHPADRRVVRRGHVYRVDHITAGDHARRGLGVLLEEGGELGERMEPPHPNRMREAPENKSPNPPAAGAELPSSASPAAPASTPTTALPSVSGAAWVSPSRSGSGIEKRPRKARRKGG